MAMKKLRFLFQGDSVTDADRDRNSDDLGQGYPKYFRQVYEEISSEQENLPDLEFVNRAVNGDRSIEILERLEADIIQLKPDFLSIQIGVNDAWRIVNPAIGATPDPVFKQSLETVLKRVRTELPETKVILIEPFLLLPYYTEGFSHMVENELTPVRRNLYQKINILRELRRDYADFYWPLDGLMHQWSVDYEDPSALALDGIHPTKEGHRLIAQKMVETLIGTGFFV